MQMEVTNIRGLEREPKSLAQALLKILAVALLPMAMAGCEHDQAGTQVAGWQLIDPAQRHPILVSQRPATLNLRVAAGSEGLTPPQRARVLDFVSSNRTTDSGNSRFVIAAPGGSENEGAAMEAADEVRRLMLASGYSETSIAVEAYHAGHGDAPLRLSYMRYVAEAPDCGDWSENLARNYQNTPYPNMGCAAQRNLAVMVSNPADLLGPRTMTERDARRRDAGYESYVKGDAVGSKNEQETIAKISGN